MTPTMMPAAAQVAAMLMDCTAPPASASSSLRGVMVDSRRMNDSAIATAIAYSTDRVGEYPIVMNTMMASNDEK